MLYEISFSIIYLYNYLSHQCLLHQSHYLILYLIKRLINYILLLKIIKNIPTKLFTLFL